jgi:site-specific recombinase XerC
VELRAAIAEMDATDQPPAQTTPQQIKRMLARQGTHPGGARARFGALSRFFDWLIDEERIPANPCQLLGRASRPKAPRHAAPNQ